MSKSATIAFRLRLKVGRLRVTS